MTTALIGLNVIAFLLEMGGQDRLLTLLALWPPHPGSAGGPGFHLWQLLSYSFLHANLAHLGFNMLGLFMFGTEVEKTLGRAKLLALYLVSVASGALAQCLVAYLSPGADYPTIGASAGVFGVLVVYALLFPRRRVILLFPPIPMPAWVFATGYAAIELVLGVSGREPEVAHFAHLGGMLGAIVLLAHWMHKASKTNDGMPT